MEENKDTIVNDAGIFNNGYAHIGEMKINFIDAFPNPTLEIHDIRLIDSTAEKKGMPDAVSIKKVMLKLSLIKLQKKIISLKNFQLEGTALNFYTEEGFKYGVTTLFKKSDTPKDTTEPSPLSDFSLDLDKAIINLDDVSLSYIDKIKGKDIQAEADSLFIKLFTEKDTSAEIYLDLDVGHLTFNTAKGGYLTDAKVKGHTKLIFKNQLLQFLPSVMDINGDDYNAFANLYFDGKTPSLLHVHKEDAIAAHARVLLTRKIQEGISPFDVEGEINASADIEFYPGDKNPRAVITLLFPRNTMHAFGYQLDNGYLEGRFINRLNTEYEDFMNEDKQNLTFYIDSLDANYHGFEVRSVHSNINFGPAVGTNVDIEAKVGGEAKVISDLLQNTSFLFRGGFFTSDLTIKAHADEMYQLVKGVSGEIDFKDLNIFYADENVYIPIDYVQLIKNNNIGEFIVNSYTPLDNKRFNLKATATNIDELLAGVNTHITKTTVSLNSDDLAYLGILSLVAPQNLKKSAAQKEQEKKAKQLKRSQSPPDIVAAKKSIKSLLSSVYDVFHPTIEININRFSYNKALQIKDFQSRLSFLDRSQLLLNAVHFKHSGSDVSSDILLDLGVPNRTNFTVQMNTENLNPQQIFEEFNYFNIEKLKDVDFLPKHLDLALQLHGELDDRKNLEPEKLDGDLVFDSRGNSDFDGKIMFRTLNALDSSARRIKTTVNINGSPTNINPFFEALNLSFDKGRYSLAFDYNDRINSLQDVIQKTELNFNIDSTILTYIPTNTRFPISIFDVMVQQDIGYFDLMLYSKVLDQRLSFEGKVDNISEFIYHNTGKPFTTIVNGYSPRIVWGDLMGVIAEFGKNDSTEVVEEEEPDYRTIAQEIGPEKEDSTEFFMQTIKTTVLNIFNSLKPEVDMTFDTLVLSDLLTINNVRSDIYMDLDSVIHLENTSFSYEDGGVAFFGTVDLRKPYIVPFTTSFETQNVNLVSVLKSLNYLNSPDIKDIDSLSGRLDFDLKLNSEVIDTTPNVLPPNTYGELYFNLKELGATGLHFIDRIIKNKKWRNRFKNIYMDSITNSIVINGNQFIIPLMEIQSNAFQLFIEGVVDSSPNHNLWVSFPLSNLNRHQTSTVPPQTGYALAGSKIYLELITLPNNKVKTKLHFSKRKFFKQQPEMGTYRDFKRKMREERRSARRKEE